MRKVLFLAVMAVLATASCVFAAEHGGSGVQAAPHAVGYFSTVVAAAALALGIAAFGCGLGQGNAVSKALEGIARQPETMPKIQMILMIGLAFIESLVLYVLFVAIILLFVNPFTKLFVNG